MLGAMRVASDSRAEEDARESAWRLWESKQPVAYSFDYRHCSGMCAGCRLRVAVKNGKVTEAVGRGRQCSSFDLETAPTMESIFTIVKRERSAPITDSIEIHYDPTWGFPDTIRVQCSPGTSDCGASYNVSNFRVSR
jgi:hypothetical protein